MGTDISTRLARRSATVAKALAERAVTPDLLVRHGIRRRLRRRLKQLGPGPDGGGQATTKLELIENLRSGPISADGGDTNEQPHELPAEFFELVLGPRKKTSCCFFDDNGDLEMAEEEMLRQTCEHARLLDGMRVLDLGCGWGSFSLYVAEHYPNGNVTAVSNSSAQGEFVRRRAAARGLTNVHVVTATIDEFDTRDRFDRIISVEIFEHMGNWEKLVRRCSRWLEDDGRVLVHIVCHRELLYLFEATPEGDSMSSHFFSGNLMPSDDLLGHFVDDLQIEAQWRYDGNQYATTCEAWLTNIDDRREHVIGLFEQVYGRGEAKRWVQRWRLSFMAGAELFGFRDGGEWYVSHYRLAPSTTSDDED